MRNAKYKPGVVCVLPASKWRNDIDNFLIKILYISESSKDDKQLIYNQI